MGFKRLKFTKLWTRHTDFPTVETDENQVRADMQLLHDEARDNLNGLMDDLEDSGAASSIGAKTPAGGVSNVQAELDHLYESQLKAGALPTAGETDQVLAKTSEENYATGWKGMAQLVAPLLGKPNLVASLGEGGKLVLNQIPDELAKLLQHCWKRTAATSTWTTQEGGTTTVTITGGESDTYFTVPYGTKIAVSSTGALRLSGTTGSVKAGYYYETEFTAAVAGKYFEWNGLFYKMPAGSTATDSRTKDDDGEYTYYMHIPAIPVAAVKVMPGSDYVYADDRNAYPAYGAQDGFQYEYAGVALTNAASAPKIACGSYVGNGTQGSANPCSVELNFTPAFFIAVDTSDSYLSYPVIYAGYDNGAYLKFTRSAGTFSWYHTKDAAYQCNTNGHVYAWFAIGG